MNEQDNNTWTEEIEVEGKHLKERIKELAAEGNVRRLIISKPDGETMLEVPLNPAVAVGAVFTLAAPVLAALVALAAAVSHVKVKIVRVSDDAQ